MTKFLVAGDTHGERKVRSLDIDNLTLDYGSHVGPEQGMCVMEAAAWVAGENWTDHPACVSPVIAAFLRALNDGLEAEDRQDLRRWIVPVIGTAGDAAAEIKRHWLIQDWLVRQALPVLLRQVGLTAEAEALATLSEQSPETCRASVPLLRAARAAADDAYAAFDTTAAAVETTAARAAYAASVAEATARTADAADDAYVAHAAARAANRADAARAWPELKGSAHDLIARMIAVLPELNRTPIKDADK